MVWEARDLATVTSAVESARAGDPVVLSVLGEPGTGKTSLLREIARRAPGFNVRAGEGMDAGFREPFGLLRQLGVDQVLTPAGAALTPIAAAQGLRQVVDALSPSGPVLIVADDVQWVDQESLEALFWLMSRAKGDRLLLALGSRPENAAMNDAWHRLLGCTSSGMSVSLTGLSVEQVSRLIGAGDSAAETDAVARLREHTAGNPFHLTSLLHQYGFAELAAMPALPAPAELAQRIKNQLETLPADAEALAHASAVLGYAWQDLRTCAAVGLVSEPAGACETLVDAGLMQIRGSELGASVRASHTLVRTAIYQLIPYQRRRDLHLRAADHADSVMGTFGHRVAAAGHYDEALAAELEHAAQAVHAAGDFSRAGQLLRWSSGLTADPGTRSRRWLDAAFDMVLARDIEAVQRQLPAVNSAPDLSRRALVQGLMFGVEKRWLDAWVAYTAVTDNVLDAADSLTRHRLLVLTAWSMICAGRDVDGFAPALARAAAEPTHDPALIGNEIFAAGILGLRRRDPVALTDAAWSVTARSSQAPLHLTYKLAWRGAVRALWGDAGRAEADLAEVTTRIRNGVADNGDGVYNGLLAFSRWQSGSFNLADVEMRIALDGAVGSPHPMNRAIEPMLLAVRGDFGRADDKLRESESVLAVMPWREPVHLHVISYIARLHAGGDPAAQQAALTHLRNTFGDRLFADRGFTGAVWIFHLAIAALWSSHLPQAETLICDSEAQPHPPGWVAWVASWLRGLIADAAGSIQTARTHLDAAITGFSDDLPLYQAHVLADHARIARLQGDTDASDQSRHSSRQLYRILGAVPYLPRPAASDTPAGAGSGAFNDVLAVLSDRERDVATLLIAGLTYAQIARDLYITRATVGFHTSRIYAKTGVTSRAGLIDLARAASTQ
jgi:DNA-binding CsgD family transcriptional regulator